MEGEREGGREGGREREEEGEEGIFLKEREQEQKRENVH